MPSIAEYQAVQSVAKSVLAELQATLSSSDSESTIASRAVRMLADRGITETWYYNCPALVLSGPRTCLSVSGKEYDPSNEMIGPTTLVTVDLSPSVFGVWGDCARTFFLENDIVVRNPSIPEFVRGREVLRLLHANLLEVTTPDTTFEGLCKLATSQFRSLGFVNLDFLGNVGHTIESELPLRQFAEMGNTRKLGADRIFTFEPHLKAIDGKWGFKHEEIYYFDDDRLQLL